jgi:hypothetical protein
LWAGLIYGLFTFAGLLPVLFQWEGTTLLRLHKFRYWIPILPPLVLMGALAIEQLFSTLFGKVFSSRQTVKYLSLGALSIVLVLVSIRGLGVISSDPDFIRNGASHYMELRTYLKEHGENIDLIWIDRDNKRAFERVLPMYEHNIFGRPIWNGEHKYINTDNLYLRAEEINTGFIIVDRDFMVPKTYGVPQYLVETPENWHLVFESTYLLRFDAACTIIEIMAGRTV